MLVCYTSVIYSTGRLRGQRLGERREYRVDPHTGRPSDQLFCPVPGPFGTPVQTFNLPAHLFRGTPPGKEEINAARVDPASAGGLILKVGGHRLIYDRTGIRRAKP